MPCDSLVLQSAIKTVIDLFQGQGRYTEQYADRMNCSRTVMVESREEARERTCQITSSDASLQLMAGTGGGEARFVRGSFE